MYAVAGRAFGRANLRPVVIASAISAIIWSLVWAGGAFEDISGDKQNDDSKVLVNFDIVLGALYSGVAAMELFGIFAAISRRASLARLYVGMSMLVVLLVAAAELLRTVVHFAFKNAIVGECTTLSTNGDNRSGFAFWGGSTRAFSQQDAQDYCNSAYNRSSFSTIAWLILAVLLTLFFASTAYAFYRQLLDPMSFRAPSDQVRLESMRGQPYGGGYVPYPGFNAGPAPGYAPPPGAPPPGFAGYAAPAYEPGKLPGYGSEGGHGAKGMDSDEKDPDAFADAQRFGAGPSEVELGRPGYRV